MAFDFPRDLLEESSREMAVVPGDAQLVVKCGTTVRILGRGMGGGGASFELPNEIGCIAASEEFLFRTNEANMEVRCLTHDGTEVARYDHPDKCISSITLAPGGLLFCNLYGTMNLQDEIIALDAVTMQPRHRFGLSLLKEAWDCGGWRGALRLRLRQ